MTDTMNPTISMSLHDGVPLCKCHECKEPARAKTIAIEWTGRDFNVRGVFVCSKNGRHENMMQLFDVAEDGIVRGSEWKKVIIENYEWVPAKEGE